MELIKKLLDQATTDEEQLILISDMINQYDLPFTYAYVHNTYKFIRYVINNVDVDTELRKDYFLVMMILCIVTTGIESF